MHPKYMRASVYALFVAAMFLVHEPGFSQSLVTKPAQPEVQRTCSKADEVEPELSPETSGVDARSEKPRSSDSVLPEPSRIEVATFGMGCFWGAEADFCALDGVVATTVGYAGGRVRDPNYRQVSSGMTGHAEVVQVRYDPSKVSYESLLDVFWTHHDPTTVNRQGPDVGTQYRSLILFHSPEQKSVALESKRRYAAAFWNPIVTEIIPATAFYPAEDYHQDYLERRGRVRCRH